MDRTRNSVLRTARPCCLIEPVTALSYRSKADGEFRQVGPGTANGRRRRYQKNIVGSGNYDIRDAIDRRVEFGLSPCP